MSVKHGMLALLERLPMHGYQLHVEFERSTGSTWPLNTGQVYTTLSRLERDGLVEGGGHDDDQGRVVYRITEAGSAELARWFGTAVAPSDRPRDELAVKVALALSTPGVDVRAVVQVQRNAVLRHLQELTRLKAVADEHADSAWLLVLDAMIFRSEAEMRWLDHSEVRLLHAGHAGEPARGRERGPTAKPPEPSPQGEGRVQR